MLNEVDFDGPKQLNRFVMISVEKQNIKTFTVFAPQQWGISSLKPQPNERIEHDRKTMV